MAQLMGKSLTHQDLICKHFFTRSRALPDIYQGSFRVAVALSIQSTKLLSR
jgi:hypothetical protein